MCFLCREQPCCLVFREPGSTLAVRLNKNITQERHQKNVEMIAVSSETILFTVSGDKKAEHLTLISFLGDNVSAALHMCL